MRETDSSKTFAKIIQIGDGLVCQHLSEIVCGFL